MTVIDPADNLLVVLSEECAEVAHRASKAVRFGLDEVQSGQPLDNRSRLIEEISDLYAVVEMLIEAGELPPDTGSDRTQIDAKKAKVRKYAAYSAGLGRMK